MTLHRLFSLGARLQLCASMVRPGSRLADIGTDHAYLPIWLAKQGMVSGAIAADIKVGPLQKAQWNIQRYHVENLVSARLSDGVDAVFPWEADDLVIAGMGGEQMIHIIDAAPWLKDAKKHLILQPMTSVESLRIYLAEQGFAVLREQAVQEDGHIYSAFLVCYSPGEVRADAFYPYIGRLRPITPDNRAYIENKVRNLEKRAGGLERSGNRQEAEPLRALIDGMNTMLKEGER